jgi:hypothetical protein
MPVLPPERHTVSIIDANAVAAGPVAPQQFEPIAGRHGQIVQTASRVKKPQLPLNAAPKLSRNSAGGACVSFPEQVSCCFVGKRLNHT